MVIILTPRAHDILGLFFKEMSEVPIMKLKLPFQDSILWKQCIHFLMGRILKQLEGMESKKST